ncbi:hypothetical protein M9H77_03700 [Catharanthus roseus]|uniref:Uncharacterized protein n=1 Tax=Catharanthus roseus TaxID=4058 RepID=A0ACC0CC71_CATRO|nr:hypothetical protein M9H77_03700 [Catharanthus roseus]
MATSESWELFVHNGRHNHKLAVYNHGAVATDSSSGRVMCCLAIYYDFSKNKTLAVQLEIYDVCSAQKIYNVVAKIKRNRMQGRNMVDEVLCLSAERGYIVFYRNREESNYNMPLLEAVGMTLIGKNFTVAATFMFNEQATTYRWVLQQIKHLYFTSAMVETTNRVESEHSVLKVWLSTCHSDLDTVFLNIDSLIQGQIAEIKYTLEISKLKEKYGAKSNTILKNLSNKVSHLALKKIMDELKKARAMVEEPGSNCLHYLRKSHDVDIFGRRLEIVYDIPEQHERDMDSEMRDLTSLIHEISMVPISKNP